MVVTISSFPTVFTGNVHTVVHITRTPTLYTLVRTGGQIALTDGVESLRDGSTVRTRWLVIQPFYADVYIHEGQPRKHIEPPKNNLLIFLSW